MTLKVRAPFLGVISLLLVAVAMGQTQAPAAGASPAVYRISGAVVDATSGAPLGKVAVSIVPSASRSEANAKTVTTAPDGRFVFESLRAAKYSLQAARRGYFQQSFEAHDNYSTAIVTGVGLESEDLVFRLRPNGDISGHVLDEQNEPIRNAGVTLYRYSVEPGSPPAMMAGNTNSNDEGAYSFDSLGPGKYLVAVSAEPWYAVRNIAAGLSRTTATNQSELDVAYPTTFYPEASDPSRVSPMELGVGARESHDIILRAVPALRLLLRGLPGAEIPQVTVRRRFMGSEIPVIAGTMRSEKGFEIFGLAPGHYLLEIRTGAGAVSFHEIDANSDGEIDPGPGRPAATVTGEATFEAGQPVPRTFIQLQGQNSSMGGQITSQGKINFGQPVAPGRYTVIVPASGLILKSLAATGAGVSGQTIQVTGQSPVSLAIELSRATAQVDGVVLGDGKPVSGVMVLAVPQNPARNSTLFRRDQSDSDGTFSLLNLAPGRYSVLALKNGWDIDWASPAARQPYLSQAEIVEVLARAKYQVKLKQQ